MKKGVIAIILLAALVVIVSPGIVGKLAEQSVDENLDWAAAESGDLVVTSESFDRGWFSSHGEHRITLGEGQLRDAFGLIGGGSNIPVLVINTRLDHGLIPVSSIGREQGSLTPGLGSAVSTMTVELADDESIELPGKIFSTIGLSGDLNSRYRLEAGTRTTEDGEVTWQDAEIDVTARSTAGEFDFDGTVGAMTFGNQQQIVSLDGVTFSGTQAVTAYGFNVGEVDVKIGPMTTTVGGQKIAGNNGISLTGASSIDDGETTANFHFALDEQSIPMFGDLSIVADMALDGVDAASLKAVSDRLEASGQSQDPSMMMAAAESELQDLVAAGFNINLSRLDVALPMGTVESSLSVNVPASDRANFEWSSLLLGAEASMDMKIPEALVQLASSMDPQVGALIAGGFLVPDGDYYIMDADLKKGLLRVNGAPIPIPFGAF